VFNRSILMFLRRGGAFFGNGDQSDEAWVVVERGELCVVLSLQIVLARARLFSVKSRNT